MESKTTKSKRHQAPGRADREGLTVIELFQMFPDNASARKWMEDLRWTEGERHCPHCGSCKTKTVPNEKPMPYHCGDCRKYFSVKTGTVMQSSKIGLQKWVIAIYLMSTSLKGVSSMKLHRDLGVTQKTAWFLAQKIRQGWLEGQDDDKLDGIVEVDETYIGGKSKNMHAKDRKARKQYSNKATVVGAIERDGEVRVAHIKKEQAPAFVQENVCPENSIVMTDAAVVYRQLDEDFEHESVNHSIGEYVRGKTHTNGIESFWATLKVVTRHISQDELQALVTLHRRICRTS